MTAAIVVLFSPDPVALERLFKSLGGQVDEVVVVDNTPNANMQLPALIGELPVPVSYLALGGNKGIAEGQNVGIRKAIGDGCSHVLLVDQDSELPPGMVHRLIAAERELLCAGEKVAAVGPQYLNGKTGIPSFAVRYHPFVVHRIPLDPRSNMPVETDVLISSGSVIRTEVLESVGFMRSDLFIDLVDTEWVLRARSKGYKSYCIPSVVMAHNIGEGSVRVFGKNIYVHSDVRKYYHLRNAIYLLRLRSMGWQWKSYIFQWIPRYLLVNFVTSKARVRQAHFLLRALVDGLLGRLGPCRSIE